MPSLNRIILIDNEFGYVGTLNAKIRENELAQAQVSERLNGLELISFEELAEAAGERRELRRLLVANLQRTVSACTQELSIVQGRLLELLGRFRQIREAVSAYFCQVIDSDQPLSALQWRAQQVLP